MLTTVPSFVSTTYTITLKHHWEDHAWLHSTYTTRRRPTPYSEENASFFWFASFYSQCLWLILLTVVPLLKYVCSHPPLLQGAGVTLARPSWCISPTLLNARFKKAESWDCAQQFLLTDTHRGSDLPLWEASTSHCVLTLEILQCRTEGWRERAKSVPGKFSGFRIRLWLETQKTLVKWRSRRWKHFDKVKCIWGNFNPFLLTFIWQMGWTLKHWQSCSLKVTNPSLLRMQDSAARPAALPQTSSQVMETPNWPWVRGISQLLVALQQVYVWLHDGKKACLQLSDTQRWAA